MWKSRFTDEQIVAIVHEAESSARATEVCRRHGMSKETLRR
jgi:transposase-like protein